MDRVNTLTVVLSGSTRVDDAQVIADALSQMRGVDSVVIGEVDGPAVFGARRQERHALFLAIMAVFEARSK